MAKIIILTKGTCGDVFPFLAAARALNKRGHQVVFLTHCSYREEVYQTGAQFISLDNTDECNVFFQNLHLVNTPKGVLQFFRQHCLPYTFREYELLSAQLRDAGQIVLLTRHMSTVADLLVSQELGRPLIRLFTALSQVTAFGLLEELLCSFFVSDLHKIRAELGLRQNSGWKDLLRTPPANTGNWPSWFVDAGEEFELPVIPLGFLTYDPGETGEVPEDVISFLAGNQRTVIITGGTGDFLGSEFYSSSVNACRLLRLKALVVTRYRYIVPDISDDAFKWVPSLPFGSIMPRASAVIHHGGSGTIARAILSNVPQLVLAYGADRPDNAKRLSRFGVAHHLPPPEWRAERIASSLERLLTPATTRQCHSLGDRVRSEDGPVRLCKVIEQLVQ